MPRSGAWLLSDVAAAGHRQLDVACTKCDRKGRLSVLRLLAEHGPDISLPDLREHVAADCPRLKAVSISDMCGVMYPTLRL